MEPALAGLGHAVGGTPAMHAGRVGCGSTLCTAVHEGPACGAAPTTTTRAPTTHPCLHACPPSLHSPAQGSSATSGAACEVQQPAVHGAAQEEQQRPLRMQGGAATAAAAAPLHPPPPAAHLTVRIKQAASVSDLAALLSQYGHAFNHIHISAALIAYHRLHPVHAEAAAAPWGGGVLLAAQFQQQSHPVQQQQQPVDQQVSSSNEGADNQLDAAQRQQPGASTSGAASSGNGSGRPMPLAVSPLASFDDASLPPLPPARALLAALLRLVRERLRDLDARGVSNVLWVLAARRYYDPALVEGLCCAAFLAANTMTAQHLATVVWSLARLGCRPAQPLLSRLVHNAAERLPRASGHDLAMLLWALPRLGERAVRRSVLLRIADAAGPLLAGASPGEAALMLNGLASARCWPGGPWMERFYAATLPGLARLSVQEAASLAWSLGVLAGTRPTRWAPPPHAWLQGLHDAAARHVGALGGADAAQMLFGFHACGMDLPQDSPLLAALFGSSSTSSSSSDLGAPQLAPGALDARSRVHLLMALASMGVQPPASWVAATLEATRERLPACGPSELAATLHALAGLGVQPGKEWLGACLEASEQQLGSYAPRELRCLLWALVRMGVQPPPAWLDALWVGSEPQLGKCAPQELISLAHSVVDLRLEPPAGWLGQLLQAAHAGTPPEDSNLPHAPFNGWSVRQLCTLCHGLAELGVRPSEPWLSAACARASDALVDAEPRVSAGLACGVWAGGRLALWARLCCSTWSESRQHAPGFAPVPGHGSALHAHTHSICPCSNQPHTMPFYPFGHAHSTLSPCWGHWAGCTTSQGPRGWAAACA